MCVKGSTCRPTCDHLPNMAKPEKETITNLNRKVINGTGNLVLIIEALKFADLHVS